MLPFEILIEQRHKELFFRFWDKFVYQLESEDFHHVLQIVCNEMNSEEWFRQFLDRASTRNFVEQMPLKDQLAFIEKLMGIVEWY